MNLELQPKQEKPPVVQEEETALAEMNQEMGEFLNELELAVKEAQGITGEDGEKVREELLDLRNEAKFSADWWAGNLYALTSVVVGDGIDFSHLEKVEELQPKEETREEKIARAKKELAEKGITSEQRSAYKPIINDTLKKGIVPFDYRPLGKIKQFIPNLVFGSEGLHWSDVTDEQFNSRQDAWRLYLGIPQKNNTFEISNYQANEKDGETREFLNEYCYKIKDFWERYLDRGFSRVDATLLEYRSFVVSFALEKIKEAGGTYTTNDAYTGVMGSFSFHLGQDEKGSYIAYDDTWDLNVFPENEKGFFGKPFQIYDRLYYDPVTFEPIFE